MKFNKQANEIHDSYVENSTITQNNIHNVEKLDLHEQLGPITKSSIIQEVLEGIIDLSDDEVEATELDVQPYTIQDKIDHNGIVAYKEAYDTYMGDKPYIDHRLRALESGKNPLASKRLYKFVQRVYSKHCHHANSDNRIQCVCDEIKSDLLRVDNMGIEETAIVPSIVFYVFAKCHILTKPPIQT